MEEKARPCSPENDDTAPDTPAAVDWMAQQAAADKPLESPPALPAGMAVPALAPETSAVSLAAREKRVADALRGNDRLTEGLPAPAAGALMEWGLELARVVVNDTAGLNDSAAEDVLQPRVRAVRRLMMAAARATDPVADIEPAEWLKQAAVVLGGRYSPVDQAREAALRQKWRSLAGRPQEQIAALRQFIEKLSGTGS